MYRVAITTDSPIEPGTDIYQSATDDAQSIGKVLLTATQNPATLEALVVLQIAHAEANPQTLHAADKNGPKLVFLELPYAFPEAS